MKLKTRSDILVWYLKQCGTNMLPELPNGADMLPGLLGGVDMLPGLPGHANTPPELQSGADMISGIKTYSTDKVQAGVE